MNHKQIISALIGLLCMPLIASAQSTSTVSTSTTAAGAQVISQTYTICTQNAIRKRDAALVAARGIYNASMTTALEARTVAETSAVALPDDGSQDSALQIAAVTYGNAARQAQEALKSARQDALTAYDEDTRKCKADKRFNQGVTSGYSKKVSEEGKQELKPKNEAQREVVQPEKEQSKSTLRSIQDEYKKKISDLKSFLLGSKQNKDSSEQDDK